MTSSANLPLNELENHLFDPNSDCYLERILDLVTSVVFDCDFPSAKNSPTVQAFLNRFKKVAELIQSHRIKYEDFELIKVIGMGGFGRVELARHKRTRRVYAVKTMSKQHLLDRSQSGFWEERDVMVRASSDWLVACHHAFLDKDNVYLCMEYMPGGDLYHWLDKCDTFDEATARFYLAETVLALETLHNMRFIHRDLKPENMLLDARGHLKLADFGSCVRVDDNGYHICDFPIGTPDYISPEMLVCNSKARAIGPECDWWSVGIIAFEMLFGNTPFYGSSLVETYAHILAHESYFSIPTDADPISPELEDLIRSFLKSADSRLGSLARVLADNPDLRDTSQAIALTSDQVKSHPYFKDVVWHQLRSQDPPLKPVVNSETDTSNIDFDEHSSEAGSSGSPNLPHSNCALMPTSRAPAYFTGIHLSFAGFTFNRDHVYLKGGTRFGDTNGQSAKVDQTQSSFAELKQKYDLVQTELSKLRVDLQAQEKQSAMDQVALKDTQRRLNESISELDKTRQGSVEQEKALNDLRARLVAAQTEHDRVSSELGSVRAQIKTVTNALESERSHVLELEEEKTIVASELDQLRLRLQETELKLGEQMKLQDHLQTTNQEVASLKSQNDQRVTSLEKTVASLQAENREARQKAQLLMTEASNLSRNHTKQVNELNDQLEEAHRLCLVYQTKCETLYRSLDAATLSERTLREEVASVRAELEAANATRRTLEDRLLTTESQLASTHVELRSVRESTKTDMEESQSQITRLSQLVQQRATELDSLSGQLDEMRLRCAEAEQDSARLTTQVSKLQKECETKQRNMDALVDKVYNEYQGRMAPVRKRAKEHDVAACAQMAKNYKNLQSETEKIKLNMQNTINQYKHDLAEAQNTIASLTEDCSNKDHELAQMRALVHQLYTKLDQLPGTARSTPVKNATPATVLPSGDAATPVPVTDAPLSVTTVESPVSTHIDLHTIKVLEQIVDLDGKGKGRKKLLWLPKYAVLKPFVLAFYGSRAGKEMNSSPVEEILLCRVIHVRKATSADLIHAQSDDLQRTLQLFYQSDETPPVSGSHEGSEVDLNATMVSLRSASIVGSSNGHADTHIQWLDHTFQPMRFRFGTVLCEVCNRPCSELRNPPLALECTKCRIRIHMEHVEQHQKFVACNQAAKVRYIRLPSVKERSAWLEQMNYLIHTLREMQQTSDRSIESGLASMAPQGAGSLPPTTNRSARPSSSGADLNHKRSSLVVPRHSVLSSKSSSRSGSPTSPSRGKP